MYRSRLMLLVAAIMSLGTLPSTAGPTDVVATIGSALAQQPAGVGAVFFPGDDDLVRDANDDGENDVLVLTLKAGQDLTYVNLDVAPHTLTSVSYLPNSTMRLFDSGRMDAGEKGPVARAQNLQPGEYKFFCELHSSTMKGTLTVVTP